MKENNSLGRNKIDKNSESDISYFKAIKKLRDEKMDWDFDDFKLKTQQQTKKTVTKNTIFIPSNFFAVAAIFILMIGFCLNYFVNNTSEKPKASYISLNKTRAFINHALVKSSQEMATIESIQKNIKQNNSNFTRHMIQKPNQKQIISGKKEKESTEIYNSNYVLVNGKPIDDESKAIELTTNSMNLLASQLNKSANKIGLIKNLKINL